MSQTITSAEFKKQISKNLSENLKNIGFIGSGFHYKRDSENFIFVIGVQASQYGGKCCIELGIHPKEITDLFGREIDFKRLKYYECEFRMRIQKKQSKKWWLFSVQKNDNSWWDYSNLEKENIKTSENIFLSIKDIVPSILELFENKNYIFDSLEKIDLTILKDKIGYNLIETETRLFWALTKIYEKRNPSKAIEFAKIGLSKLVNDNFSGREDFENIIKKYT